MLVVSMVAALSLGAPRVVWSTTTRVAGPTPVIVRARGLTAGAWYLLVTRGVCEIKDTPRRKRWRARVNPGVDEPFGTEFRVGGGVEEYPVGVGEHRQLVRAPADTVELRLEDRSSRSKPHTFCRLTSVAFETID
ncbi:MAG: hypothetical protein INH41_27860 [Myxococcaceae bacterium]|jgi:hypothetical protein|nr:hypothetical protein [Myxococcaceae bacterium]